MIESLLLTTARVSTFFGTKALTGASGFFVQRDERLYFVTNRHVLTDRPSGHRPDRIEIEVHTNADNVTHAVVLSVLLYRDGQAIWHQGRDSAGDIDIAAIELDRGAMPAAVMLRAFTPAHLQHRLQEVTVGTPLLVVGFPWVSQHAAPSAGGAAGRHRVVVRPAFPGPGLLPDRCTNPPRDQRRAGGDARRSRGCAAALEGCHS